MWGWARVFLARISPHNPRESINDLIEVAIRHSATCKGCLFSKSTCEHPDGPDLFPIVDSRFVCLNKYNVVFEAREVALRASLKEVGHA